MGYIYKITNLINKKNYIGQTIQNDPYKRWSDHKSSIKYNKGCPLLSKAISKYGVENFKFEILIICFDEDVYTYEKDYIKKYKSFGPNGYNATEGGEPGGNFKGKTHTDEVKNILRKKATEWNNNPVNKLKISKLVCIGLENSDKWKKAKEEGRVGTHPYNKQPKSEEVRQKISETLKEFFVIDTNRIKLKNKKPRNGRQIYQCSLDNAIIKEFINAAEAARQIGLNRKTIQACLAGRNKTAGGYIWKYANKELKDAEQTND
jgi:group I intron endonuclease